MLRNYALMEIFDQRIVIISLKQEFIDFILLSKVSMAYYTITIVNEHLNTNKGRIR